MLYATADNWLKAPQKRVMLFGMSGLGKTWVSGLLREAGWFHYSVDYRIGTRYMGEHIVDNFKAEAMKNAYLAELLRSDSIYIGSNITFDNLEPLSTYLGKPGDPARGGILFEHYLRRQRQHRLAEISAMADTPHFIDRAARIYGYDHFICDTSGSMVEVIDPKADADPVMEALTPHLLPVWIEGTEAHVEALVARFSKAPKPMYYQEAFLKELWGEYTAERGDVDPDAFILWGYQRLLDHRLPRYRAIANRWGITVPVTALENMESADDFTRIIADAFA
ncbi:MAG: ATPase [Rhodobacteraceae bacterium]|nr:ATPase [Paracoccaceae bacterium]